MDVVYFTIPKDDPFLLKLRAQRARLEVGETPEKVYVGLHNPRVHAAITLLYLKHVEMGETEVSVKQIATEAEMYIRGGGRFGPTGRGIGD